MQKTAKDAKDWGIKRNFAAVGIHHYSMQSVMLKAGTKKKKAHNQNTPACRVVK